MTDHLRDIARHLDEEAKPDALPNMRAKGNPGMSLPTPVRWLPAGAPLAYLSDLWRGCASPSQPRL